MITGHMLSVHKSILHMVTLLQHAVLSILYTIYIFTTCSPVVLPISHMIMLHLGFIQPYYIIMAWRFQLSLCLIVWPKKKLSTNTHYHLLHEKTP